MEIVVASIAFAVAALCAGLMGYAIQRGATCTVAAMEEILAKRSARRLAAMVEASAWVAGGLLIAQALGLLPGMPVGFALGGWTIVGGVLLGLGAYVNRACVFGSVARVGSGEWCYLATPAGFFVGSAVFARFVPLSMPQALPYGSPVLHAPAWVAGIVAIALVARVARPVIAGHIRAQGLAAHVWAPHAATTVIGVTFLVMLLLVGAWAYTDVLAELAHGMAGNLPARFLLFVALLGGAVLGGWTAGRLASTRVTPSGLLRCFLGGFAMAFGGLLIPGGNDGLILVGMPLLWPYAWIAFVTMCASIAVAHGAGLIFSPGSPSPGQTLGGKI